MKLTRRARFLTGIERAAPWKQLEQFIELYYPKVTGVGRHPIGILRMYIAQQCLVGIDEINVGR